jgi:hypothetical protein
VSPQYENYLTSLLSVQEQLAPRRHLRKFELVKGDVVKTFPAYLRRQPETVVAFAYFDLDIYLPTKACLRHLRNRLTKGSVLGFDEVCLDQFPGETSAKHLACLNIASGSHPLLPRTYRHPGVLPGSPRLEGLRGAASECAHPALRDVLF